MKGKHKVDIEEDSTVQRHTDRLTHVHLTLTSFKLLITPSLGVSPTASRSVNTEG